MLDKECLLPRLTLDSPTKYRINVQGYRKNMVRLAGRYADIYESISSSTTHYTAFCHITDVGNGRANMRFA